MEIIIRRWEHYNRSLGKYISTKRQYFDELKKQNMIPFEEGCRLAEKRQAEKKWKPSKRCIEMINEVKNSSRDNKIILGQHPRIVDEMRKMGTTFELPDWLPEKYKEGGYAAD